MDLRRFARIRSKSRTFSFDGDVETGTTTCDDCNETHETTTGFVLKGGSAFAVYWSAWYPHHNEAWLDMIIGSWVEPDYSDHVTFGCRIGLIDGSEEKGPQCSLVAGGDRRTDHVMFGRKLSRDEALEDPNLKTFWNCVDWLMLNDPLLHANVYHHQAQ